MMSLTFGPFTQVSGSGPLGPLVCQNFQTTCSLKLLGLFQLNRICSLHANGEKYIYLAFDT